jgi:hypothetical protein
VKRFLIAATCSVCGLILLGVGSANVFPDQTWKVLASIENISSNLASTLKAVPTGTQREMEEKEIYEAVFRDLIDSNHLKLPVFLSIDSRDPTDEFIARFATSGAPVKKMSAAYFDSRTLSGPIDPTTGQRGIILSIRSIKWLFGDRVDVSAGYNCGSLCGEGGDFQLAKRRGRWMVKSYTHRWSA